MISVIVPMYNSERTVAGCLEALIQSAVGVDYEIVAVDDGSVDRTAEIVEAISSEEPRLHLYRQNNRGVSCARNFGMQKACGDVIAFVDSDDYVKKQYFPVIEAAFRDTDADVVFFAFERVDESGKVLSEHRLPEMKGDFYEDIINLSRNDMFGYTWIKAFRREIIKDVSFDEKLSIFEDEVFSCEVMSKHPKLLFINEPIYRYVRGAVSLTSRTHQNYARACDSVFVKWRALVSDSEEGREFIKEKAEHFAKNSKYYVIEKKVAKRHFLKDIAESEYITAFSSTDRFLNDVRNQKILSALMYIYFYRAKVLIGHLLGRQRFWKGSI